MAVGDRLAALAAQLGDLEVRAVLTKATLADMEERAAGLDVVYSKVTALDGAAAKAAVTMSATAASGDRGLSGLEGRMVALSDRAANTTAAVVSGSSQMADAVQRDTQAVEDSLSRASSRAHGVTEQLAKSLEAALDHVPTRLEDLEAELARFQTGWSEELQLQIDAIQVGAGNIREFITLLGNAQIGSERLRQFLKGLDFNEHTRRIQALIDMVLRGRATLDQVVTFIGDTNLAIAARLRDTIKQFQEGTVTLQYLLDVLQQVKGALPGEQFGALADAIAQALSSGGLS